MSQVSMKKVSTVLIEASVVGVVLAVLVKIVKDYVLPYIPDVSGYKNSIELFIITGIIFHVICEYSGVNIWYAREYCKLF